MNSASQLKTNTIGFFVVIGSIATGLILSYLLSVAPKPVWKYLLSLALIPWIVSLLILAIEKKTKGEK